MGVQKQKIDCQQKESQDQKEGRYRPDWDGR